MVRIVLLNASGWFCFEVHGQFFPRNEELAKVSNVESQINQKLQDIPRLRHKLNRQSTPGNSNLQGKLKKLRVIGSSSYRG